MMVVSVRQLRLRVDSRGICVAGRWHPGFYTTLEVACTIRRGDVEAESVAASSRKHGVDMTSVSISRRSIIHVSMYILKDCVRRIDVQRFNVA